MLTHTAPRGSRTIPLHSLGGCARPSEPTAWNVQRRTAASVHWQQRRQNKRLPIWHALGDDAGGAGMPEPQHEQAQQSGEEARSPAEDGATSPPESDTQPAEVAAESAFIAQLRRRTLRLQALEAYEEQMGRRDEEIDSFECALLIAKHAHPDLDGAACRREVEDLARGVREGLPEEPVPLRVVQGINTHLFDVHGFRGNTQDFYNPDNSCINKVLENRTGIPITMALLYSNIAARVGLPMIGLNLPGHFMLTPTDEDVEVLIDAFAGGEVCFLEDAADKLATIHGIQPGRIVINPAVVRDKAANAIKPRQFLSRMLHNLKQIYQSKGQPENVLAIIQYLRATVPTSTGEIRDEGLCLYALERYAEAAESLQQYLDLEPKAADHAKMQSLLSRMRRVDKDPPEDASPAPG